MLLLALSVVLLGTARAAGTSVSSCPLDKVLIQNGNSIVVDVRALGHCHNHEAVAHILKTASVKRSRGQITMSTYLTHSRHKGPYRDSCRKGIVKSIRSFEDNSVVADMSLLICFCGLARAFTTEIVQNGNILTDGNPRAEFEFREYVEHQFNNDGMQMCKEFRRRAISNCMSHAIGNTATGFTDLSLEECISSFDHVSSLVRFNSHITHQGALDYTEQFVDTMIARETVIYCLQWQLNLVDKFVCMFHSSIIATALNNLALSLCINLALSLYMLFKFLPHINDHMKVFINELLHAFLVIMELFCASSRLVYWCMVSHSLEFLQDCI